MLRSIEIVALGLAFAYLLLLFAILYVLIARVFAPRLRKVIDDRASTIAGALEAARKLNG